MKIQEGDQIVTCGVTTNSGISPAGHAYFAPKVYIAVLRKKDKTLVWRLWDTGKETVLSDYWRPSSAALKIAKLYAKERGLPFVMNIKHNDVVTSIRVRKPSGTVVKKDGTVTPVVEQPVGRFRTILGDEDVI